MRSMKLLLIICLLFAVGGGLVSSITAAPSAVITVNSEGDAGLLPGVSCTGAFECTLRQAILIANDTATKDTIRFDTNAFPNGMVITPLTALPEITKSLDIDGVGNNPGVCPTDLLPASITVTIDGSDVEPVTGSLATPGFWVKSQDSTIKGLSIVNFPGSAIILEGANTAVTCNHLGLTPDGEAAGNFYGVVMEDGASQVVGGPLSSDRNVISDNYSSGVHVSETNFTGRLIVGNYIGLDEHGISEIGNSNGIYHEHDSVIIQDNVISGNREDGIYSEFGDTTDLTIEGNIIGLSAIGNIKLGNQGDGIEARADSSVIVDNVVADNGGDGIYAINGAEIRGNYVGTLRDGQSGAGNNDRGIFATGQSVIDDNVVSDNYNTGITLIGDNIIVTNNRIGTTEDGSSPLGNTGTGIALFNSSGAQIGGSLVDRNIIGDNIGGILLNNSSDNTIEGNYIGVGADSVTNLGNTVDGIELTGNSNNNQIGTASNKNTIANNSTMGIELVDGNGNNWRHNIFYGNGGLGINLHPSSEAYGSITPNDPGDADSGPNNLQNFLELSLAESTGRLVGTLEGSNNPYTIDIYQIDNCDGSGYGEGGSNLIGTYIRSTTGGVLDFDELISPAPPLGSYLVSLVTDADGNTSEFSNCVQIAETTFVVDSAADYADNNAGDGICESTVTNVCTLRAAIEEVNALGGGPYAISFGFGFLGITHTIEPDSALPTITTPVIIDASTMINATCPSGNSAASHYLILDGRNLTSGNGLRLADTASGSTIRGLRIRNFPDSGIRVDGDDNVIACNTLNNNTLHGVNVIGDGNRIGGTARSERNVMVSNDKWGVRLGDSATLNKVQGNYVGVEGDGTTAAGNADSGIFLSGGGSNRIGGSVGFAANVISANGAHGIELDGGSTNNQIWGNIIGLDASGSTALGNTNSGIYVNSANSNDIGAAGDSKGNVIAANGEDGIYLNSSSNYVQGNFIGTDVNGLVDLGNGGMGIRIVDGDTNLIGGDNAADGNVIAGNDSSGIYVSGHAVGTTIRHNSIGVNAGGNALGNTGNGVGLAEQVSQALVRNNSIAHNGKDGIAATETVISSKFTVNEIYENGELGIDLNNDDVVNANDSGDGDSGGNGLMNYPVILAANADNNSVMILLDLAPAPLRSYRIHFYRNQSCDSSGHGEGQYYLGSFDVATTPYASPIIVDTSFLPKNFNAGDQITATATPLTNPITDGTSEFSACFTATGSTTQTYSWGEQQVGLVVNTTAGMQPAIDNIYDAWTQNDWVNCPTCAPATTHLLPFKETASHLGRTNNVGQFGDWLGDFKASGGGGCADESFDGLREFAANLSDEGAPVSDAIVFSDAPPIGNRRAFGLLLDRLIDRGIRVHNVGRALCNNENLPDDVMNHLTLLTGGQFHNPASIGEYKTDTQIAMNLAMSDDLFGSFFVDSVRTFQIEVDSSVRTIGVSWTGCLTCINAIDSPYIAPASISGSGFSVELIDPDGNVVDNSMPGYRQLSTSSRDMQLLFETVNESDAGTWQVRVTDNGPYTIDVFGNSAVHMKSVGKHMARVNQPFKVGAFITVEKNAGCGHGCRPATATLKLVGMDNQETIAVDMFNIGMPPSVYGGSVTVQTPGLYRLVAEGELENGTKFMRVDPTPIRVRTHGMSGSGDKSALPGSTHSISFELSNDGVARPTAETAAKTFDLELFSEQGWTTSDSIPESVTLAAGESVFYTVDVVIPPDAEIGSIEESVLVAVPQDDLSATVSVSAKTLVAAQQFVFLPVVVR